MRYVVALTTAIAISAGNASAQKMNVTIVNRQNHETQYSYVVPGRSTSTSNASANCYGNNNSASCNGSGTTDTLTTAPQAVSFSVVGATFALLIPDGRVAVVNCISKFAEHFAGPSGNHRSCRIPLVDNIEAEFNGKNAKLRWVVSLDGKTTESETYRIVAVLDKQPTAPAATTP